MCTRAYNACEWPVLQIVLASLVEGKEKEQIKKGSTYDDEDSVRIK